MKDNRVKGPAIAAFILQTILVYVSVYLIQHQGTLGSALFGTKDMEARIIPVSFWLVTLKLVIYGILFVAVITGNIKNKRLVATLLIIFAVAVSCIDIPLNLLTNKYFAGKGAAFIAAKAAVSNMISFPVTFITNIANPLFLIACGRLGSDRDIKVPGLLALIFQGMVIGVAGFVILNQNDIGTRMGMPPEILDVRMFPIQIFFPIITLAVYISFYISCQKNTATNRKGLGICYTLITIFISYIGSASGTISTIIIGRFMGTSELAAYANVTYILNASTAAFTAIATAFFFVAVGRFGISGRESEL